MKVRLKQAANRSKIDVKLKHGWSEENDWDTQCKLLPLVSCEPCNISCNISFYGKNDCFWGEGCTLQQDIIKLKKTIAFF